jgi:hypothetical protein
MQRNGSLISDDYEFMAFTSIVSKSRLKDLEGILRCNFFLEPIAFQALSIDQTEFRMHLCFSAELSMITVAYFRK